MLAGLFSPAGGAVRQPFGRAEFRWQQQSNRPDRHTRPAAPQDDANRGRTPAPSVPTMPAGHTSSQSPRPSAGRKPGSAAATGVHWRAIRARRCSEAAGLRRAAPFRITTAAGAQRRWSGVEGRHVPGHQPGRWRATQRRAAPPLVVSRLLGPGPRIGTAWSTAPRGIPEPRQGGKLLPACRRSAAAATRPEAARASDEGEAARARDEQPALRNPPAPRRSTPSARPPR